MESIDVVPYVATRLTKLGLATVTIKPEGDLVEATLTITDEGTVFSASAIFGDAREAFFWTYGVRQKTNDYYSGYTRQGNNLVEKTPPKNRAPNCISVRDALIASQDRYNNFELSKTRDTSDKLSLSAVKSSTLVSAEEKVLLESVFARLGKARQGSHV